MKKKYKFVFEDNLLIRKELKGGDAELQRAVDDIVQNKKAIEMVKLMGPLDIASVIAKDYSLCPHDAAKATIKVIQHVEGIRPPSIETNKEYPVPPVLKKDGDVEESMLGRPDTKIDITPRFVFNRGEFPPDPRDRNDPDWPYDDHTKAGIDPKNKGRKRPLMTSKDPTKKKFIFKQDLASGQPGGDGAGGGGLQQTTRQGDGSMPGSGTSWQRKGTAPGWASSPPGKEFDLPDDTKESIEDDDELNFQKNAPVGSPVPNIGFDVRTPDRRMGFRRK